MYLFFYMNVQKYCPWYKAKDSCSYILWSVNKSHEIRWKDPLKKIIVSTALTMTHSHQFSLIQSTTAASLTTLLPKLQESKGVRWPRQPAVVFCTIWELPQPPPCLCVNVWCVEVFFFFREGSLHLATKIKAECVCVRAFVHTLKCVCSFEKWMIQRGDFKVPLSSAKEAKRRPGTYTFCVSLLWLCPAFVCLSL